MSEVTISVHSPAQRRRRRRLQQETCLVCGDVATAYHYGGLSCDSCKVFFRRSVRTKMYAKYKCQFNEKCQMTSVERKRCSACRYVKCRRVGMEPKWVSSGVFAVAVPEKEMVDDPFSGCVYLPPSSEGFSDAFGLANTYWGLCQRILPRDVKQDIIREFGADGMSQIDAVAAAGALICRTIELLQGVVDLWSVDEAGRDGVLVACALRHAYDFARRDQMPSDEIVAAGYLHKSSATLMSHFLMLVNNIKKQQLDEPCVMILGVLAVCSAADPSLTVVRDIQDRYLSILRRYIFWLSGRPTAYAKALSLIADARLVIDHVTNGRHAWIDDNEYLYIRSKLPHVDALRHYSIQERNTDFVPLSKDPYNVLADLSPSKDMISRGIAPLLQAMLGPVYQNHQAAHYNSTDAAVSDQANQMNNYSSANLFELIESIDSNMDCCIPS